MAQPTQAAAYGLRLDGRIDRRSDGAVIDRDGGPDFLAFVNWYRTNQPDPAPDPLARLTAALLKKGTITGADLL